MDGLLEGSAPWMGTDRRCEAMVRRSRSAEYGEAIRSDADDDTDYEAWGAPQERRSRRRSGEDSKHPFVSSFTIQPYRVEKE